MLVKIVHIAAISCLYFVYVSSPTFDSPFWLYHFYESYLIYYFLYDKNCTNTFLN